MAPQPTTSGGAGLPQRVVHAAGGLHNSSPDSHQAGAFLAVGGLDARYGRGYFEDTDLAMSLHLHGYQVRVSETLLSVSSFPNKAGPNLPVSNPQVKVVP